MLFERMSRHDPARIALRDDAMVVRYSDVATEIESRVEKLEGVKVLGLALDNGVEWVLWDLAALKAGIPCVPLPPFFTKDQVFHVLQTAGVTHVLSPQGLRGTGIPLGERLPKGTAKVTFTSGTTGTPKGVCLPQSAMEDVASSIVGVLGEEFKGTHVPILPLAVLLENVAGVYAGLMAGCTIHLTGLRAFGENYANIHRILQESEATSAILVPEILRVLIGQAAVNGPLQKMKFIAVGGSKIDATLITQARQIGLPVYEGYGLSECASVISLNTPKNERLGTAGQFLPHVRARIVDGEIQVKDPGYLGYVGEVEATNLLNTGDLGALDESGYLSITGRKKNVLITSYGRNVSPEWVEAVLLAQPAIAQAVVHGDAQPALSAIIVPSAITADIKLAVETANLSLPDYARIQDFQIVPSFTAENNMMTGNGRPRRDKVLEFYTKKEKNHELLQSAC